MRLIDPKSPAVDGNSTKLAKSAILQKEAFFACGQG